MNKISIILIICTVALLTSTTLILANPSDKAAKEDRREYTAIEPERIKHERKITKEKRKHSKKSANERRQYLALIYMWMSNKHQ